jgi:hypothetical protein
VTHNVQRTHITARYRMDIQRRYADRGGHNGRGTPAADPAPGGMTEDAPSRTSDRSTRPWCSIRSADPLWLQRERVQRIAGADDDVLAAVVTLCDV